MAQYYMMGYDTIQYETMGYDTIRFDTVRWGTVHFIVLGPPKLHCIALHHNVNNHTNKEHTHTGYKKVMKCLHSGGED